MMLAICEVWRYAIFFIVLAQRKTERQTNRETDEQRDRRSWSIYFFLLSARTDAPKQIKGFKLDLDPTEWIQNQKSEWIKNTNLVLQFYLVHQRRQFTKIILFEHYKRQTRYIKNLIVVLFKVLFNIFMKIKDN